MMDKRYRIREFVRNTLGCTCPDEVFDQIDDRGIVPVVSPHARSITIGGRLLVYIWRVGNAENLGENISALLAAGRKERDERGLNRFRAVLAVDGLPQDVESDIQSFFTQYPTLDDRVHLHVIPAADTLDL